MKISNTTSNQNNLNQTDMQNINNHKLDKTAVVFAYHNVGVRCIKTLLDFGIKISLIITHEDNPKENIWFDSVKQLAIDNDILFITPDDANDEDTVAKINKLNPDFIFSFYYRNMLKQPILDAAKYGAYNMHGSLLPYYRGRVPINWAIINGEKQTGATLHQMNVKPDNGPVVDQMSVPILIDDTAQDVFNKVTVAAEMVLVRSLSSLCSGKTNLKKQDLSIGGYFGGRKPEDGRIKSSLNAKQIHNFIRALAKPYPGAFCDIDNKRVIIWKSRIIDNLLPAKNEKHQLIYCKNNEETNNHILDSNISKSDRWFLHASLGGCLEILEIEIDGMLVDNQTLLNLMGKSCIEFS